MHTILIIEDQGDLRDEFADQLTFERYRVRVASDGKEGLAAVAAHSPDLILCDIAMPVLNGFQVLDALRNQLKLETPVILMTAYENTEHNSKIKLLMDTDTKIYYLTKPFRLAQLLKTIKKAINSSHV